MLLKKIKYSQLFSFGQFQNETIGLEAELERGEDPKKAMRLLKVQVINMHDYNQKIRDLQIEIKQHQSQIDVDNYYIDEHSGKELNYQDKATYEAVEQRLVEYKMIVKELKDTLAELKEV